MHRSFCRRILFCHPPVYSHFVDQVNYKIGKNRGGDKIKDYLVVELLSRDSTIKAINLSVNVCESSLIPSVLH